MRDDRIAYFNGLKIMAAVCVSILFHYYDHFLPSMNTQNPFVSTPIIYLLSKNSNMFVEMFFIISGLLFKRVYFDRIVDGLTFKDFAVKRIVRLYPVMITTVLVMYVLQFAVCVKTGGFWNEEASLSLKDLFMDCVFAGSTWINARMTQNAPIWYINILLLCYLWAYGITKLFRLLIRKYKVSRLSASALFLIPMLLGIFMTCVNQGIILWNVYVARGYISFFMGFFLEIFLEELNRLEKAKHCKIQGICILTFLIVAYACICPYNELVVDNLPFTVAVIAFPSLIIGLYDIRWINWICKTKLVTYLGNISFGIYIWNFPIYAGFYLLYQCGVFSFGPSSKAFILINVVVHFIVAILSYELIEKRFTNKIIEDLKKRNIYA